MGRRPNPRREQQLTLFRIDPIALITKAVNTYTPIARVALLSGGDDSSALTHWLWAHDTHGRYVDPGDRSLDPTRLLDFACFIDTGTGIAETKDFVYRFCGRYGIPLRVMYAPPGEYDRAVLRWGFPGPAGHSVMYERLKERQLERLIAELKSGRSRYAKVLLYTGVRRAESTRRMGTSEPLQVKGGKVWCAPMIDWTKGDLAAWRAEHDVPRSDVAAILHSSGECLCGAFAAPGELQDLRWAYPRAAAAIERLEARADFYGVTRSRWGGDPGEAAGVAGPMCTDCAHRQLALVESGACALAPPRPRITGHERRAAALGEMTAIVHTPGREPGRHAVHINGMAWVVVDDHLRTPGGPVASLLPDPQAGFRLLPDHPDVPALPGGSQWEGLQQTAVDLQVKAPKRPRRSRRSAAWQHQLIVYCVSSVKAPPEFDLGPVRLGNCDRRVGLDRVRLIRGRVLLDEDPIAAWQNFVDPVSGSTATGWVVQEVGRFQQLLIIRRGDQEALEGDWAAKGITVGYVDVDTSTPWRSALVVPARHAGPRLKDLPAYRRCAWAAAIATAAEQLDPGLTWDAQCHQRVREALGDLDPTDAARFADAVRRAVADEGYRTAGCSIIHPDTRGADWAPAAETPTHQPAAA